jgi:hypothetical protein
MFSGGGRRRWWGISSGTSLLTHVVVGLSALLLGMPHFDTVPGVNAPLLTDRESSIAIDLVPYAEASPAESPAPAAPAAPASTPRVRQPRNAPLVSPPPARSLPENDLVELVESGGEGAGGGTLYRTLSVAAPPRERSTSPQAPGEQPPAISATEASYLRTYETFPNLPASLWVAGRSYVVMAQVCVSADGKVQNVSIKDGAARDLEQVITASVRSWRYEPRMVGGQPRPFCHLIRFVYSVRR